VYILVVEAIERQKTGVEYAEINGITVGVRGGRPTPRSNDDECIGFCVQFGTRVVATLVVTLRERRTRFEVRRVRIRDDEEGLANAPFACR
jgi:hypothetical protein